LANGNPNYLGYCQVVVDTKNNEALVWHAQVLSSISS